MGIFNKLFAKKTNKNEEPNIETRATMAQKGDVFIAVDDNSGYKILRILTEEQKEKINRSTIPVLATQLYMHYWTDNLDDKNPEDQTWQNQVVFFWEASEPFPKKSLPPIFETFKVRNFIFISAVSIKIGQTMPWFGMPGLGKKHFCEIHGRKVSIPELNKLRIVDYLEKVELTTENFEILNDRKKYFFLIDENIVQFKNNNFYIKDKPIPIEIAYAIGAIHIVKRTLI